MSQRGLFVSWVRVTLSLSIRLGLGLWMEVDMIMVFGIFLQVYDWGLDG